MPIPDKKDLRRFCELDGWEVTEATNPDHDRYRKRLGNGSVLRTKVSHGRGPIVRNPGLWTNVWRRQLALESEDEFWDVLSTRKPARRGEREPQPLEPNMDAWLHEALVHTFGMDESEVLATDADAALALYLKFCEGGTTPA